MPYAALAALLHVQTEHQLDSMAIKTGQIELTLPVKLLNTGSKNDSQKNDAKDAENHGQERSRFSTVSIMKWPRRRR